MIPNPFKAWIGGEGRRKTAIKNRFSQPCGPSKALKLAATTTVGKMKGRVVAARSKDLPGKLKRAKRNAAGSPTHNVNAVERTACHTVKLRAGQICTPK